MSFSFSTGSFIWAILIITAVTIVPVKIAADMFGALNKEFKHCALAVVLGTLIAAILIKVVGGFAGLILAFIAMCIIYWQILQISLIWSFLFTVIVLVIQFALIELLGKIGLLSTS